MVITSWTWQSIANLIGGSASTLTLGSGYMNLGSSSGTLTTATTGLTAYMFPTGAQQFTGGSADLITLNQIGFTSDWSTSQLSGLVIKQFGIVSDASGGKFWQVENMTPITFNGTQELEIYVTWQVY